VARNLLRLQAVKSATGLTATDIYDGQKKGTFPRSVAIGKRAVAWVDEEVQEWITQRIEQRDAQSLEDARKERRRKGGPGRGRKGPMNTAMAGTEA
jgi:prophage regulatory protein